MTSQPTILPKASRKIILKLNENHKEYYGSKLIREIGITNRTLYVNKLFLISKGIIEINKDGSRVYIRLTPKGKQLAAEIIKLKELLKWIK